MSVKKYVENFKIKNVVLKFLKKGSTRSKLYKKNTFFIILLQGLNTLVNFLLVSATLNILGVKEYGVWITLTSFITWFNFMDIGLSHGLRNSYAEAKAKNDQLEVRKLVSTTFFSLLAISLTVFLVFGIIAVNINWTGLLNAPEYLESDLRKIGLALLFTLCIKLILKVVVTLRTADQNPAISNIIITGGNILGLLGLYFLIWFNKFSFLNLGLTITTTQLVPLSIVFIYYFTNQYKNIIPTWANFSFSHLSSIFNLGGKFFGIQLGNLFIIQTNVFIIAHFCGQEDVTQYNITFKYLWVIMILFMAILTPLWSATTESFFNGDKEWIIEAYKKMKVVWLSLLLIGILLVAVSPTVYNLWLKGKVEVDFILMGLMLLYFMLTMYYSISRTFMNGISKIKLQFLVTLSQAILHIPLAILGANIFGLYGVLLSMILWPLFNSIWEPIQFKKIINKRASGIWNA